MDYKFDDFTDRSYAQILKSARKKWSFISFKDAQKKGRACLWRHDVDFSLNRSLKFAQIENMLGVKTTYFIHLHSIFYNPMEDEQSKIIKKISDLGHWIGLHFDPHFYLERNKNINWEKYIKFEQNILETILNKKIEAISIHNPDVNGWKNFDDFRVCRMINTYSKNISDKFYYVSDSNGYWRHKNLIKVIKNSKVEKLHVLTHPGLWQEKAMSPNNRIRRCATLRAKNAMSSYDNFFIGNKDRKNIK